MREKTLRLISHPLFSGSALMIVGSNLVNGMNYLYHFSMGRLLGVNAYGELVALFSFISILSMIPMSFSMVITKFVSSSHDKKSIQGLLYVFHKYILLFTISLSVFLLVGSAEIAHFLHITNVYFVIGAIVIFLLSLPVMINRSALQGLLRFPGLVTSLFSENFTKLFLGVLFVFWGWSIGGALVGLVIANIVGLFVAYLFLRDYSPRKEFKPVSIKPLIIYSLPVFVNFIAVTLFSNTDLLLVKHYFSAGEAGTYAAAAVLSKIIIFGVSPIATVMFPIISKRHGENSPYFSIFLLTLGIVAVFCLCAILGFTFLSSFVIWVLYGKTYIAASALLSLFSIYASLFSLSTVFTNYFLAKGDTKAVFFSIFAALLQIIGIIFYHTSLIEVLWVSISVSALLLGMLIVYSIYER